MFEFKKEPPGSLQRSHPALLGVGSWFFAGLLLLGCPESPKTTKAGLSSPTTPLSVVSARETWRVECTPTPSPIPLNEHFSLRVRVRPGPESERETLAGIHLEVDADMPAHGHGINTAPETKAIGPGVFEVEGLLFHMPGEWELYLDVVDGPLRERATFPISLE